MTTNSKISPLPQPDRRALSFPKCGLQKERTCLDLAGCISEDTCSTLSHTPCSIFTEAEKWQIELKAYFWHQGSLSCLSALCHTPTGCPGWDLLPHCSASSLTNNPKRPLPHLLPLMHAMCLPYGAISPCLEGPPRAPSEAACPLPHGLMGGLLASASPYLSLRTKNKFFIW